MCPRRPTTTRSECHDRPRVSPVGSWPQGQLARLVHVAPAADVRVEAFKGDAAVACALHHGADHIRPRHREGPGTAVHGVGVLVRYDRDDLAYAQLRVVHPGVVFAPAPDDLRERLAGLERAADVLQSRARIPEVNAAETRT